MNKYFRVLLLVVIIPLLLGLMEDLGTLKLKILDSDGNQAHDVIISLEPIDVLISTRKNTTDLNGETTFKYVKPGKYQIIIKTVYNIYKEEIMILPKSKIEKTIKLTFRVSSRNSGAIFGYGGGYRKDDDDYDSGKSRFEGSKTAQGLFKKNYFVSIPAFEEDLYPIYKKVEKRKDPVFITTDLIFHTAHLLFDYSLRLIEIQNFYPKLRETCTEMLALSINQYKNATNKNVKKAALMNVAFFSVMLKINDSSFEPIPEIASIVSGEINSITSASKYLPRALRPETTDESNVPEYLCEDYSQYKPRGHYTRRSELKKYFKMAVWAGRYTFYLKPGDTESAKTDGRFLTLQSLLMMDAVISNETTYKHWKELDKILTFIIGATDDLSFSDYEEPFIAEFGRSANVNRFADKNKIDGFITRALKLRHPAVLSQKYILLNGPFPEKTMGFRFLGQRTVPDNLIFQKMVYHHDENGEVLKYIGKGSEPFTFFNDPNAGKIRGFPRGLDIMAVLGSDRALQILKSEGDTDYSEFDRVFQPLRDKFKNINEALTTATIYSRYIRSIIPMLKKPQGQFKTSFLKTEAWMDKMLNSALAAWAELRHDTILYIKQDYGPTMGCVMQELDKFEYPCGYVEPYPEVYENLRFLMTSFKKNLVDAGFKQDEIESNITHFEEILAQLETISSKELEGKILEKEEYVWMQTVGHLLSGIRGFSPETMKIITDGSDERMDVIVDVYTNPTAEMVLEEGVGKPLHLFVYIDDAKGKRICRGAAFSYYEFKWPMNDRLTDAKWQSMPMNNKQAFLPKWTKSFLED